MNPGEAARQSVEAGRLSGIPSVVCEQWGSPLAAHDPTPRQSTGRKPGGRASLQIDASSTPPAGGVAQWQLILPPDRRPAHDPPGCTDHSRGYPVRAGGI